MERLCVVCQSAINGQKVKYCSNACKQKGHCYRIKEQTNTYFSQTLRSLRRKSELISLMGGGCANCGYDRNHAALHFHHLNPNIKEFKLDMRILSNKRWDLILKEAEKCVLLCSNCHAEEHNPELFISSVQRILRGASVEKSADEQGVNSGKPSG